MSNETTDKVERSLLRATGQFMKQHAPKPVADHTAVLASLIESGDRKDQQTIRLLVALVVAAMTLTAVLMTLLLGGSFQATREGVAVNAPAPKESTP